MPRNRNKGTSIAQIKASALAPRKAVTLHADVKHLIEQARQVTATAINSALVILYWQIGTRIHQEILGSKRAKYGAEILPTLSAQLGWSHFVELLSINDKLKREFYAEMCRIERWSVRMLRSKISGMLFERTALSQPFE